MMLMLIGAGGNLWADEVTFTPGTDTGVTSVTKNGVTATMTTMNNASYYQIYANQSATFTISNGTITKIEFTCTAKGTSKYGPGNASADVGSYSYSGTVGTWSGSATSVTISSTAQVRMTSLTITYTKDASSVIPPTFSPESGVYLGPQTVEISCTTAEATIYYTTDGTEPTTESNVYSSAFSITPDATVKAIAVKNGVSSDVAVAEYIMGTADLAIDFEKVLEAYTAWNFTKVNRFEETSTCGAHSGSYYAGNSSGSGGTETASIQTKETVDNPDKFTCYISKYTSNTKTSTWYIQVSSDGSTWTDVATRDATNMAVGTWVEFSADLSSYSDVYVRLYYEGSTAIRCVDDITLTLRDESKQDVTLSFPETTYEATMGSEFTAPTASAEPTVTGITYSSSNEGVATVDAETGAVTLVAAGTTTITATFAGDEEYNGASASYTLNVARDPNGPGTQNNPYTVAQAREFIETLGTESSDIVYVSGIVSQVDKFDDKYSSITYWISDDGTTSSQLECYSGKGLESADFSSVNDIQVGDIVTVAGTLKKYNDIYEFNHSNYLVSFERPSFEIAAQANDNTMGSVSLEENVITATPAAGYRFATPAYTVTSGTATVTQDGNEFVVDAETDCTVQINFEAIPTHTVTWSINGTETTTTALEDAAVEFPAAPEAIEGKTFVGWTTAAIDGETDTKPELVSSAIMGTADQKYYAVFANKTEGSVTEVTDELTREFTGVTENTSTYSDWSDKSATSTAVYAGQSAGGKNSIQLRSNNNNSGVISTTSGGNVKKVVVTWNSETASGRTLNVYGANTAYEAATDLYDSSKQGTLLGTIVNGTSTELAIDDDYQYIGLRSNSGAMYLTSVSITWEGGTPATYSAYCTNVILPAPEISLAEGKYTAVQTVSITASEGVTIYYTLNGGAKQEYTEPLTIESNTTLVAWAEKDGLESEKVTRNYTIVITIAGDPANFEDGFYQIKNNGNEKYVNVAGRKTVTFVGESDAASMPGTVIKLETGENGQVKVLRSQGVDVPGYATRALNYVDKFFNLAVEKLELQDLLGHSGAQSILTKFHDSFDEHLYIEQVENGYRIYGKTPSMKPVVDFYQEHQAEVDYKLPKLEQAVNNAINKVIDKVGHGYSLKNSFSIHEIWERMGKTLTEPVDETSIAAFYTQVLTSETNVWKFAYEAAMKYVEIVEKKDKFIELKEQYPEYFKYYEMAKRVQPDFKYYIAQKDNQIDFISQGNIDIANNDARAIWTIEKRTDFKVEVPEANKKVNVDPRNGGTDYFTTLYTDFGYTLPDGVRAYQITGVKLDEKNETKASAIRKEIKGNVPAQTPVLLVSKSTEVVLQLAEDGTALDENALYGNDYLIEKDGLKNTILKTIFETVKSNYESLYNNYMKDYEHLMLLTAGTVNNKYFFGLSKDDDLAASPHYNNGAVMLLGHDDDLGIRFHYATNEDLKGNEAFMLDESGKLEDIVLFIIGDVNRDGQVSIADVTATVNIILGKDKPEDNYDYDAANVNMDELISIADVTALVNIILGKPNN